MRFIARSLTGLLILAVTLGLFGYAGLRIRDAVEAQEEASRNRHAAPERSFVVTVELLKPVNARSIITAYGELQSSRTLELRAAISGHIVEVAPQFRDGALVKKGALLFRIDPAQMQSALERARIALAEAEAEREEAIGAVKLAVKEHAASQAQARLRAKARDRQQSLRTRGVGTEAAVEAAALALSAAEQIVIGREQALANARNRVTRAGIALRRQRIAVADAERELAQTTVTAPFDGLLADVNAVLGRLVNVNEKLGELIDPDALEAAFRISNSQFSRLLLQGDALAQAEVTVRLELENAPIVVPARLDRAGAEVGEGQTGRLVYARLAPQLRAILRPGDFVTVEIPEPEIRDAAIIPATAATEDGRILLVTDDDRLEEATIRVLRRQGDYLIVADAPFGRRIVTERLPQLGPGVRVRPAARPDPPDGAMPAEQDADDAGDGGDGELIALDPDRRARLVAWVQGSDSMPEDAKARILSAIAAPRAPRAMVERIEARMGG